MPLHLMLGLSLFVTFVVVFFFMLPGSSAASVRLQEVTQQARRGSHQQRVARQRRGARDGAINAPRSRRTRWA